MSAPPIHFDHVTKHFGAVVALDDLTFDAPAGQIVGFLGPNGAGKSTAIRILTGLVHATTGAAYVAGRPFTAITHPARTLGVALESLRSHPGRSGYDHLVVQALTGGISSERVGVVAALVGLGDAIRHRIGTYSLGMRQRLNLANALLGDPPILVLDEPANGLDPEGVRWLRMLLRDLAAEGRTVLVSSHGLAEMEHMADQFVILAQGRLVAAGRLEEITQQTKRAYTHKPALEEVFVDLMRKTV